MQTSFSLFAPRDSWLHRLNPLTKLIGTLTCVAFGLLATNWWGAYVVFLFVLLPLALWGKIARSFLNTTWKLVLPFAISVFLIQGLFWTDGTPIFNLGPLSFKQEGLEFALISTGRILAMVASFLLFSYTTRPDHLMITLAQRGVPDKLAYVILATIQIVPRFQAKATTILDAQQARGLDTQGNYWQRFRALVPLVEPLILGSIIDIDERAIALESRAFGSQAPKTFLLQVADSRAEMIVRGLLIMSVFALIVWRLLTFIMIL